MARIYPLNATDRDTLRGLQYHWQTEHEDELAQQCAAALAGSLEDMRWVLHELQLRPVPRSRVDYYLARLGTLATKTTPGGAPGGAAPGPRGYHTTPTIPNRSKGYHHDPRH